MSLGIGIPTAELSLESSTFSALYRFDLKVLFTYSVTRSSIKEVFFFGVLCPLSGCFAGSGSEINKQVESSLTWL